MRGDARRQRGFTLFELVVCLLLITVLATLAYLHYQRLAVDAERAAFRGVLGWLRAGINLERTRALGSGQPASLEALEGTNPMALLARVVTPPANYVGERNGDEALAVPGGRWYFDSGTGQLVYRVRYAANRRGLPPGVERVGFSLKVHPAPADKKDRRVRRGLALTAQTPGYDRSPLRLGGR
ncbi:Tfp pilus assembly protein FimT/FimU [Motiliproteus sp. SC1-56]|uniref:pilus assembly FimT family protein n=1 Tax=Motiliproteus sp. SC1-56 TaxID=2799565 RepID=UPI001A8EC166|nr:prepilin-type N-terminal cleavage/methylation domain-containing protein [Motiliproteus sp. SC1-56]